MKVISGLVCILTALFIFTTCDQFQQIKLLIEEDMEALRMGENPEITVFSLTSNNPTNNPDITFQLSGSENIVQWCVNENSEAPEAGSKEWNDDKPTSHTLSAGDGIKSVYAWAVNEEGNTSEPISLEVELDTQVPVLDDFTLTSSSPTDNRDITFTLSGSSDISRWMIVEDSSSKPAPNSALWLGEKPPGYTIIGSNGIRTIYAWARDPAGNVSNSKNFTVDLQATPVATLPGSTSITGHEKIIIEFTDSMNTGAMNIAGDLFDYIDSLVWDKVTNPNDRLTLEPAADGVWPDGASQSLVINGLSDGGLVMEEFSVNFDVERGIYVDDDPSVDQEGTRSQPISTITGAISIATTRYSPGPGNIVNVYVRQGSYSGNGPVVTMAQGVCLYGGYSDANWDTRDTGLYVSTISDTETTGTMSYPGNNRAVEFGSGVTGITVIDGFTVIAGGGQYAAAVMTYSGTSGTVQNCVLHGGTLAQYTHGFVNYEASPTIQNNTIDGGTPTSFFSYGLYNDGNNGAGCEPVIQENIIDGGKGDYCAGITCANTSSSTPVIRRNVIFGGDEDANAALDTTGIYVLNSSPEIYNNTIHGGKGENVSRGIRVQNTSSPVIRNNTIDGGGRADSGFLGYCIHISNAAGADDTVAIDNNILTFTFPLWAGTGYGIYENNSTSDPASVRNNNIDEDCNAALYYDNTLGDLLGVNSGNFTVNADGSGSALSTPAGTGNLSEGLEPDLDSEYRYTGSLAGVTFDTAGLDGDGLSWGFTDDKDETIRTGNGSTGWSIGAYEY